MRARIYPKADAKTQWWETSFARGTFSGIEKILLHTTETTGWPGYKSGSAAPTLTYHPRLRQWRQHCYLDRSARALVDPAGTLVRENRDNVIQIEIIAYSDEPLGRSVGGLAVSQLTDDQLGDIADFIAFVRREWGGPPLVAPKFLPYPQSAGDSSVRMSGPEYDAFRGVLGHQHASGNGHGDPGSLNVSRILKLAGGSTPAPTTPTPAPVQEDIMASIDDLRKVIRDELYGGRSKEAQDRVLGGIPGGSASERMAPDGKSFARVLDSSDGDTLRRLLVSIAGKVGVDVDEAAIASALLDGLKPAVAAAVSSAVAEGVPTGELADAVVARLGQRLSPPA